MASAVSVAYAALPYSPIRCLSGRRRDGALLCPCALRSLVLSRKMQPSAELPHMLPLLLAEAELSAPALSAVHQLARLEGPTRWPRLLYSSTLKLSASLAIDDFSQLVGQLVPSTLEPARPQELESLAESLVGSLVDAAALRIGANTPVDVRTRGNLAHALGVWPPSDRSLAALLKALGGGGRGSGGGGGGHDGGRSALLSTAAHVAVVRRGLLLHVQRARPKLGGTVLESIAELLRGVKTEASDCEVDIGGAVDESPAAGARRAKRRHTALVTAEHKALAQTSEERTSTENSARDAIAALKGQRPLYSTTRLPELQEAQAVVRLPKAAGRPGTERGATKRGRKAQSE